MNRARATSFEDLEVWKKSHQLVLNICKLTRDFPAEEKFGLVSQLRRAAISIPANIAEGFKKRSSKDKSNFYNIAEGSLEEVKYYLILSKDLNYSNEVKDSLNSTAEIGRKLNGLISSLAK
jgi:four helix bundle protein